MASAFLDKPIRTGEASPFLLGRARSCGVCLLDMMMAFLRFCSSAYKRLTS